MSGVTTDFLEKVTGVLSEFSKKFCGYITTYCEVVPDNSMVYKRKMLDCEVRQILKRFK